MTDFWNLRASGGKTSVPTWTNSPYVIHINKDPSDEVSAATVAGALVRTLPLAGLRTGDSLDVRATEVFEIPHPPGGIDSMADWLTDLEWLDVDAGVLFIIDAENAEPKVMAAMMRMLPFIVAWWQLWPQQTTAYVVNVADVVSTVEWLAEENNRIEGRPMAGGASPAVRIPILVGG